MPVDSYNIKKKWSDSA